MDDGAAWAGTVALLGVARRRASSPRVLRSGSSADPGPLLALAELEAGADAVGRPSRSRRPVVELRSRPRHGATVAATRRLAAEKSTAEEGRDIDLAMLVVGLIFCSVASARSPKFMLARPPHAATAAASWR